MGRTILAVLAGYATMFAVVFVCLAAGFAALGPEGAFEPGGYETSTLWLAIMIVVGLVAAVLGGVVCAAVARRRGAVLGLAVFVLLLGLAMAVPVLTAGDEAPKVRPEGVAMSEAMMEAKQPVWVALLNPLIGAGGALLGGRLLTRKD